MPQTISFLGDIHGDFSPIYRWNTHNENSFLIQVGDFGVGFSDVTPQRLANIDRVLGEGNNTVYVIRGNHDDPTWFNNSTKDTYTHLKFVEDDTILEILGKKILCVGGGISLDRKFRKEGKNYWPGEPMVYDDKLESLLPNNDIDIVVTHVMSNNVHALGDSPFVREMCHDDTYLKRDMDKEQEELSKLFTTVASNIRGTWGPKERMWFYGHYHESLRNKDQYFSYVVLTIDELYTLYN